MTVSKPPAGRRALRCLIADFLVRLSICGSPREFFRTRWFEAVSLVIVPPTVRHPRLPLASALVSHTPVANACA
jgi:hypothetical protein